MATREGELFVERVEVNLDGRQIFCLFCGGAVIASLVFVLGVAVGRRVEARERPASAQVGAAQDPLAALDQLAAGAAASGPAQDLSFASALRGDGARALGEVDRTIEAAARPAEPAAMLPARPLVAPGSEPAVEAAREKAEAAKEEAAREKAEAAKAEAARAEAAKAEAAKAEAAKVEAAKAEAAKAEAARAEAARAEAAKAAAPAGEARFTLHLLSFEKRAEADELVGRLRKAGYQPYVVETPEEGKGMMLRVRVGHYASFEEAVAAKADFEKKQNIIAYVTRTRR